MALCTRMLEVQHASKSMSGFVDRGAGGILYLFPYHPTENNRRDCEQASSGWVLPRGGWTLGAAGMMQGGVPGVGIGSDPGGI